MAAVPFVLVDVDTNTDRGTLARCAEAATLWSHDLDAPAPFGWSVSASVRVATSPQDVAPGEWPILLLTHPDVAEALGYHDRSPHGTPYCRVFPHLLDDPSQLPGVITHEVGEALVNPELSRVSAIPRADGKIPCNEVGDPVEAVSYDVTLASGEKVGCSAWVTPAYFEPPADLTGIPLAKGATVSAPGEILEGGYQIFYDPATRTWTQQQNGRRSAYREALADAGWDKASRLAARAVAA